MIKGEDILTAFWNLYHSGRVVDATPGRLTVYPQDGDREPMSIHLAEVRLVIKYKRKFFWGLVEDGEYLDIRIESPYDGEYLKAIVKDPDKIENFKNVVSDVLKKERVKKQDKKEESLKKLL
jgi:hypothetical protein